MTGRVLCQLLHILCHLLTQLSVTVNDTNSKVPVAQARDILLIMWTMSQGKRDGPRMPVPHCQGSGSLLSSCYAILPNGLS